MDQPSTAGATPADIRAVLTYDGKLSELFGIFLVNLLLTIITFGIFRFWAITRTRRYLWSHMRFDGTPFSYTGKGKDMFLGFLRAMLILVLLFSAAAVAATALQRSNPALAQMPFVTAYVGLAVLFGAAHFSAQRYRLSRTEWRGIRGGMEGSALRYGVNWLIYLLLCVITLSQAVPWMQVDLARWRINASRFGSASFRCEGRGRRLWLPWLAMIIGYILLPGVIVAIVAAFEGVTLAQVFSGLAHVFSAHVVSGRFIYGLGNVAAPRAMPAVAGILAFIVGSGLLAAWYYSRFLRLILGNTTALVRGSFRNETLQFGTTVEAGNLYWLVAGDAVILVLTFGLGMPVVLPRHASYLARTTFMAGTFDANTLAQSTVVRPTLGEGFLPTLDPGIV